MSEALTISVSATTEQNSARPAGDAVTPPAVRAQLERILGSKAFARSPRISRFLSFVVDQTLQGQESKLKEYLLGVEVFGRMDSFDPRIDSIVRVEARRLRYKLDKFYESEGQNDSIYIQFRKGCYVPTFAEKRPGDAEFGNGEIADVPYVRAISNPHAFAMYARGQYHLGRWSADGIAEAISRFTHTLDEDPICASAYAGLASAWTFASMLGVTPARDVVAKAKNAASKALAISPLCSEAHAVLGILSAFSDGDGSDGEQKLRRAIHVNPCDTGARLWYGLFLAMSGRPEDGVREARKAQQAEPASLTAHLAVGFACHAGRAYDEALMQYRLVQDLDPSFFGPYLAMGLLFTDQHMYEQAVHTLNRAPQTASRNPMLTAALAYAHGAAGRVDAAGQCANELAQLAERQYVPPLAQAMAHSAAGNLDAAFGKLEEAVQERSLWLPAVRFLGAFERIRAGARYAGIMGHAETAAPAAT